VFNAMEERLEQVDEGMANKDFFGSEEFQVLLALAIEQLQTTNERPKSKCSVAVWRTADAWISLMRQPALKACVESLLSGVIAVSISSH